MFTGLVEASGQLARRERRGIDVTLTLRAPAALVSQLTLGESVAVDGACLTVTRFGGDHFSVDASSETLDRTTLGQRREGDSVHLERALRLGDRLGGHWVSGHIDAVGSLRSTEPLGAAKRLWFNAPPLVMRYVIPKGSIAIDGASLTVNEVDAAGFSVVLIPHTQGVLHLSGLHAGAAVNLEADILGKYVERLLSLGVSSAYSERGAAGGLDLAALARAGFMR